MGGGFRSFAWLWAGQTVSIFGSGLTAFALGVWVYQTTGSVTRSTVRTSCPSAIAASTSGSTGVVAAWSRYVMSPPG